MIYLKICLEELRETKKNLSQDNLRAARNSNCVRPEYKTRALPLDRNGGGRFLKMLLLFIPVAPAWSMGKRFVSLQFLNLRHSVGLLGRVISPSQGRYPTQVQNKHKEISMPRVGFEPMIPAFEREKTVHALDCAATLIGFSKRALWK
jgi:hypothetical protein